MEGRLFKPQSGNAEGNVAVESRDLMKQNIRFKDRVEPYLYTVPTAIDETRLSQDSDMVPLGDFLSRPQKIAEYEWGTGVVFTNSFNPWSLFLSQNRVANRFANYNLMRCKLKLRFLINGNAFQYGRLLVYYRPLENFDQLSSDAALVTQDLIQGSQCPHIYLDPNTSQGGELELPFFWHENYFDIPNESYTDAGTIYMRGLNALKHANGATDVVTISVFAWAEDVQLSVLTSQVPENLGPQSGEIAQANSKGWISGPATTMSQIAGALTKIPAIAPYATAAQMASSAIAKMAMIFGYCKPAVTKTPEPYRPTTTSTLAVTNVPDNSQKLTVDHQQDLTIDPRISGIDSLDPLNILSIAQRESYLTTFDWAVGTAPDTLLWNARVQPALWGESGSTAFHWTSLAAVSLPFEKWTGSIRFRFQIVCSNFHRGRLRFIWDPKYIIEPDSNYNVTHSTIVDISEEKDFTMEIANGQHFTPLEMLKPGLVSVTNCYSSTAYTAATEINNIPQHNGILGVYVLNELTVPNSTTNNDIQINVFVSAGDDFQLFVPGSHHQRFVFKPQSGEVDDIVENTTEPSAPEQSMAMDVHESSHESNKNTHVFMGEAIASLRPLLKRFYLHHSRGSTISGNAVMGGSLPAFPFLKGNVDGAVNTTGAGDPYSYCNTTLLQWVVAGFSGWRGSLRWKVLPRGNLDNSQPLAFYVGRGASDKQSFKYSFTSTPQSNYTTGNEAARASVIDFPYSTGDIQVPPSGATGAAYTNALVNPTIEFELPFYSSNRFVPGKVEDYTSNNGTITGPYFDWRLYTNAEPSTIFDFWSAAGDDFQVYFWTGMPRMYYEPVVPAV